MVVWLMAVNTVTSRFFGTIAGGIGGMQRVG
ncbi:hypothetical protein LG301_07920 [Vreelandella venusta]